MKTWFRFQAAADDPSVVDVHIIDFIGDWIDDWIGRNYGYDMGVTAKQFVADLAALPAAVKTIRVHINSPGGDVFSALNIANALREQQASKGRTVETIVDGLAASAASIVMMAGSTVRIADNALVMVHNPWTVAVGDAASFRQVLDELDKVRNTIIATYQWHSSLDADALAGLMDATTWMDADEAVANGFATEKITGLRAAASLDRRVVARLGVPEQYRARVDALLAPDAPPATPAPAVDVLRLCKAAGVLDLAEDLVSAGATLEDAQAAVSRTQQARAAAAKRETDIRALCDSVKQPELAAGYVAGGMSVDAVRQHLTVITAKLDRVEIDGGLDPNQGQPADVKQSWKQAFARAGRPFGGSRQK